MMAVLKLLYQVLESKYELTKFIVSCAVCVGNSLSLGGQIAMASILPFTCDGASRNAAFA